MKISEYMQDDRKAVIRKTDKGFEVDLIINKQIKEVREVHDHSESYAEDVAENFVLGMFDPKVDE
tara:strand:- start:481 stop:675 length:195 start_codon:yes stop_codon:yes gene_type:complete